MAVPAPRRSARSYVLTGTGAFDRIFKTGQRREGAYLQVVFTVAEAAPGRAGLVLGKKALRLAVDRNRVRRMLRERLRAARPRIEAYNLIVRLKRGAPRSVFCDIAAEATRLLDALPPAEPPQ